MLNKFIDAATNAAKATVDGIATVATVGADIAGKATTKAIDATVNAVETVNERIGAAIGNPLMTMKGFQTGGVKAVALMHHDALKLVSLSTLKAYGVESLEDLRNVEYLSDEELRILEPLFK